MLLMTFDFDRLGCNRIEFKTDASNLRSQDAIERIGAILEGVLRQHMIVQGGHLRDSVYFSIVAPEWQAVKARLEQLLQR